MGHAVRAVVGGIASIFGGGGSTPKVNTAPAVDEVAEAEKRAKASRAALLETAGGQAGAVLQPGQVGGSRDTLLGN